MLPKSVRDLRKLGFDMKILNLHLDKKIAKAIEEGQMAVHHCGHFGNGRYDFIRWMKNGLRMVCCPLENAQKIDRALKGECGSRSFITIASCLNSCPVCDEDLTIETNGKIIRPTTECKYPDGMIIEFELNVPSGKIVAKDDLRPFFDFDGEFNINSNIGTMKTTLAMAKIGCAHGFVGNSCPGVYAFENDRFTIANGGYKDSSYKDEDYIDPEGEQVASICTDLWWYSLVDYDEFKRRAGKLEPKGIGAEVFKVKPGVYHFCQCQEDLTSEKKEGAPYVYAKFQWVREPEPIVDLLAKIKSKNFTLGQIVHRSQRNYPTLYANGAEGARIAIEHIFCVVGGGGSWHDNGFIQYDPDMPDDEPETVIPKFDKPTKWHGLSAGLSAICVVAGVKNDYYNPDKCLYFNSSFLKAAFDIARNIYLFGAGNNRNKDSEQRDLALRSLKGLAKRYPDDIPEDCKGLLMSVIDQANWVLESLHYPAEFSWRTVGRRKNLWLKNKFHEHIVKLSEGERGRPRMLGSAKFMKHGHSQNREAITWELLIGQFALWIMGKKHESTEAMVTLFQTLKLRPKNTGRNQLIERITQTSYNKKQKL